MTLEPVIITGSGNDDRDSKYFSSDAKERGRCPQTDKRLDDLIISLKAKLFRSRKTVESKTKKLERRRETFRRSSAARETKKDCQDHDKRRRMDMKTWSLKLEKERKHGNYGSIKKKGDFSVYDDLDEEDEDLYESESEEKRKRRRERERKMNQMRVIRDSETNLERGVFSSNTSRKNSDEKTMKLDRLLFPSRTVSTDTTTLSRSYNKTERSMKEDEQQKTTSKNRRSENKERRPEYSGQRQLNKASWKTYSRTGTKTTWRKWEGEKEYMEKNLESKEHYNRPNSRLGAKEISSHHHHRHHRSSSSNKTNASEKQKETVTPREKYDDKEQSKNDTTTCQEFENHKHKKKDKTGRTEAGELIKLRQNMQSYEAALARWQTTLQELLIDLDTPSPKFFRSDSSQPLKIVGNIHIADSEKRQEEMCAGEDNREEERLCCRTDAGADADVDADVDAEEIMQKINVEDLGIETNLQLQSLDDEFRDNSSHEQEVVDVSIDGVYMTTTTMSPEDYRFRNDIEKFDRHNGDQFIETSTCSTSQILTDETPINNISPNLPRSSSPEPPVLDINPGRLSEATTPCTLLDPPQLDISLTAAVSPSPTSSEDKDHGVLLLSSPPLPQFTRDSEDGQEEGVDRPEIEDISLSEKKFSGSSEPMKRDEDRTDENSELKKLDLETIRNDVYRSTTAFSKLCALINVKRKSKFIVDSKINRLKRQLLKLRLAYAMEKNGIGLPRNRNIQTPFEKSTRNEAPPPFVPRQRSPDDVTKLDNGESRDDRREQQFKFCDSETHEKSNGEKTSTDNNNYVVDLSFKTILRRVDDVSYKNNKSTDLNENKAVGDFEDVAQPYEHPQSDSEIWNPLPVIESDIVTYENTGKSYENRQRLCVTDPTTEERRKVKTGENVSTTIVNFSSHVGNRSDVIAAVSPAKRLLKKYKSQEMKAAQNEIAQTFLPSGAAWLNGSKPSMFGARQTSQNVDILGNKDVVQKSCEQYIISGTDQELLPSFPILTSAPTTFDLTSSFISEQHSNNDVQLDLIADVEGTTRKRRKIDRTVRPAYPPLPPTTAPNQFLSINGHLSSPTNASFATSSKSNNNHGLIRQSYVAAELLDNRHLYHPQSYTTDAVSNSVVPNLSACHVPLSTSLAHASSYHTSISSCFAPGSACPGPGSNCPAPASAYHATGSACPAPGSNCLAPASAYHATGSACPAPGSSCPVPASIYYSPGSAYGAPASAYNAFGSIYHAPASSYHAPGYTCPEPVSVYQVPAPASVYQVSSSTFQAPASAYQVLSSAYQAPAPSLPLSLTEKPLSSNGCYRSDDHLQTNALDQSLYNNNTYNTSWKTQGHYERDNNQFRLPGVYNNSHASISSHVSSVPPSYYNYSGIRHHHQHPMIPSHGSTKTSYNKSSVTVGNQQQMIPVDGLRFQPMHRHIVENVYPLPGESYNQLPSETSLERIHLPLPQIVRPIPSSVPNYYSDATMYDPEYYGRYLHDNSPTMTMTQLLNR